jgi:hypothetical protein
MLDEMVPHRKTFERMVIRDLASILENEYIDSVKISEYKLANDKIDV